MKLRTGTLVVALGLSGALLAGCGDDGDSDEAAQSETQEQESSQQSSDAQSEGGTADSQASGEGSGQDDAEQSDMSDAGQGEEMAANDSEEDVPAMEPVNLIFGTGGTGGSYYPIGGALKSVFEDSDVVDGVQVVSTGASVQNINNINDGLNQIAIVMSDVAYDAVEGQNQFEGNPANITAIAGLYPNVVQIVATADSGIESVEDLAGKRVGVGKVGSGVEQSASKVLESAELSYDDLARVSHTGYADSVTEMSNGNLDAAFFTSGVPNSSITGLMQSTDVTFVPVDGDVAATLLENYPYYQNYEIPQGAPERYDLGEAVNTVAIRNLMIVGGDMREDVAEKLAERFHDYLESGNVSVGALNQIDPATLDQDLVVPVHPGAESYYATMSDAGGSDDASADMNGAADTTTPDDSTSDDASADMNSANSGDDVPGAESASEQATETASMEENAEASAPPEGDGPEVDAEKQSSAAPEDENLELDETSGNSGQENASDEGPQS